MQGFPQYAPSSKQGNVGVSIVSRIVEDKFGWLFKRNHQEHDFGIDGQIEVVTDEGAVTGQMLACQIKNGPSFFRESNRWGYIYRGETKHFNYLANCSLPVIIVICDPNRERRILDSLPRGRRRNHRCGMEGDDTLRKPAFFIEGGVVGVGTGRDRPSIPDARVLASKQPALRERAHYVRCRY